MSAISREDIHRIYSQLYTIYQKSLIHVSFRTEASLKDYDKAIDQLTRMIKPTFQRLGVKEIVFPLMAKNYTEAKIIWEDKKANDPETKRIWSEYKEKKADWVAKGSISHDRPERPNIDEKEELSRLQQVIKGLVYTLHTGFSTTVADSKGFCFRNNILCPRNQ